MSVSWQCAALCRKWGPLLVPSGGGCYGLCLLLEENELAASDSSACLTGALDVSEERLSRCPVRYWGGAELSLAQSPGLEGQGAKKAAVWVSDRRAPSGVFCSMTIS